MTVTNEAPKESVARWAVQISRHYFFLDIWEWSAHRFISDHEIGESEFGGAGFRSVEAAQLNAQAALIQRGISQAVLIKSDGDGERIDDQEHEED